jgi:hypothetical protein
MPPERKPPSLNAKIDCQIIVTINHPHREGLRKDPARTPADKTDWHLAISDDDRRRKFTSRRCA